MPSYRGHVAAGCCVYVGMLFLARDYTSSIPAHWLELFTFTLIGSLFPDVDTKSKGQQLVYALSLWFVIMLIAQGYIVAALGISLCCFLPLVGKHRGIFHDPLFLMCGIGCALIALIYNFPRYKMRILFDMLFFVCGVISHIVLDRLVCTSKTKRFYKK